MTKPFAVQVVLIIGLTAGLTASQTFADDGYASAARYDPPLDQRDKLTLSTLLGDAGPTDPVHYGYFLPIGPDVNTGEELTGRLTVPAFTLFDQDVTGLGPIRERVSFPQFSTEFTSQDTLLLPIAHDRFLSSASNDWEIILSAGRVWSDPEERDWSRAALPFTLIWRDGFTVLNGAATFAYRNGEVSRFYVQIGQEGSPSGSRRNLWGSSLVSFAPDPVADREVALKRHQSIRNTDFPVKGWHELEAMAGEPLTDFDNAVVRPNVSVSGLLVDGKVYRRGCHTRFGPYPFCDHLRHSVFSVSKSLGAAVAMLRLAQVYGEGFFDERITEYVPLTPTHDGWDDVTFGDALNMATGIGNLTPERVSHYVDTDATDFETQIWAAPTVAAKLRGVSAYSSYPWGPGEVLRYKSSDTMILSIAMDRFLRAQNGGRAGLWEMLSNEVYQPLGMMPVPTRMAIDETTEQGVPRFDGGMFPTYQETMKLAALLANGGEYEGRQILHPELTRIAMSNDSDRGLPSGWHYDEGGQATYDMSFWLAPFLSSRDCQPRIPIMSGYGGSYVQIMPNDTIGFRFADSPPSSNATYDSAGIRRIANVVRPFCEQE